MAYTVSQKKKIVEYAQAALSGVVQKLGLARTWAPNTEERSCTIVAQRAFVLGKAMLDEEEKL